MIQLQNTSKQFLTEASETITALHATNLSIYEKEFVVLVGGNGSGKSTLLNVIAGSFLPTAGSIFIDEVNVTQLLEHERSKWISRVFQNPLQGTAANLSIIENFRLAHLRTKTKKLIVNNNQKFKLQVQEQVKILGLGLEDKINQQMGSLSGGQRQALTLLMSIADDCKVLLMDEPTSALDPKSANIVLQTANTIINQYKLTACMVTHNLKDALAYGNRIIQLQEGKIVKDLNASQKQKLTGKEIFDWF